jgi:hypothetical protein
MERPAHKLTKQFCPYCGCGEIHRSHRSGVMDYVFQFVSLLPYRCADCERRFHR